MRNAGHLYRTYDMPPMTGPDGPVETVAIIGYGNQGRAQAHNFRASGLPVVIGLREKSPAMQKAESDGFKVGKIADVCRDASAIVILVPDEFIGEVAGVVQENARDGSILVLAHGASLHFNRWKPREGLDCGLIAPHGPGLEVLRMYNEGSGVPAILAIVQDATGRCAERLEILAAAIGCGRKGAGIRWSTLQEEVETDLFVEQALLVGGVIELLRAVVATMIRAGYDPAICRMSTIYELPHIANIYEKLGPVEAFKAISPTAAFGAAMRGPRLVDQHTRRILDDILEEIRSGNFLNELESPEAPILLNKYIDDLEASHLAKADKPFQTESLNSETLAD